MRNRRGQTIVEYTVIIIVVLGVLIAMKDYVKRDIQGRWKSAADDLGDPYDPTSVNSTITYATQGNSVSFVTAENGTCQPPQCPQDEVGQWTSRLDTSSTVETKTGSSQVGN